MKRFTHSLLAISLLFTATAISAQDTKISGEEMLSGTIAGDYKSTYTYDNDNRLTLVESSASKVTFDYSPTTLGNEDYDMTMRISDPSGDIVCYLEIGDNGFITKSLEIEESTDEQSPYKTYTFSYDAEGHLTRINEVGIVDFSSTTFEYTGDNMTSVTTVGNTPSSTSISYTPETGKDRTANTAGVMDFDIFGSDDIETRYFYRAGLLGVSTADLPIRSEKTTNGNTTIETYIWCLDNEGRPTSRTTLSDNAFAGITGYAWSDTSSLADNMLTNDKGHEAWYGINGMRHNNPTRGINIAITADGSAEKTFCR